MTVDSLDAPDLSRWANTQCYAMNSQTISACGDSTVPPTPYGSVPPSPKHDFRRLLETLDCDPSVGSIAGSASGHLTPDSTSRPPSAAACAASVMSSDFDPPAGSQPGSIWVC